MALLLLLLLLLGYGMRMSHLWFNLAKNEEHYQNQCLCECGGCWTTTQFCHFTLFANLLLIVHKSNGVVVFALPCSSSDFYYQFRHNNDRLLWRSIWFCHFIKEDYTILQIIDIWGLIDVNWNVAHRTHERSKVGSCPLPLLY